MPGAEAVAVRDFLLNDALTRLAADAAVRLSALVAGGEQIPFDVAEQAGPDSLFHSYQPLTSRFVLEREDEIRGLASFAPARDAVDAAGVAVAYLERCGEQVPSDPRERAARVLVVFVASLWDGCTEFSLDRERLERAVEALDAETRDADDADVLIAPIVGLKMTQPCLPLPHGVRLIRADAIEAPVEAMRSEGMGRQAWEPQFLAVAEQDDGPDSAAEAMKQLHELISVMRLFKAGGIGLGPYAFAPGGSGRWSRVPTRSAATRPGGYRLDDEEAERLAELAIELEARPDPDGALAWGVGRFELGCVRETAMEGLSDHLLALRAVLDGHGPVVGASLPMRASALIADESCDRIEARGRVESALELERALMNGAGTHGAPQLAGWIEEVARRLLRKAALGELGTDLGTAADESLIANGLAEGDAEISVTVVSDVGDDSADVTPAGPGREAEEPAVYGEALSAADFDRNLTISKADAGSVDRVGLAPAADPADNLDSSLHSLPRQEDHMDDHHMDDQETRIMEPVPAEDEIRITATNWLDEVAVDEGTMEWTAATSEGVGHREPLDTPRVRHLFQVPEDADWEVRELEYDHYDRRAG